MTFLQIKNTENEEPKVLKMGRDFDTIKSINLEGDDTILVCDSITLCKLSDCYQSRPLLKMYNYAYETEFYEFDINHYMINDPKSFIIYCDARDGFATLYDNNWVNDLDDAYMQYNLGSIFSEENKHKYPELYKVACEYIKKQ
jgi:hypothetical protein